MSEQADKMKTIIVFQTLLQLLDFPFEEEIKCKPRKAPKMKARVQGYFEADPAPELSPDSTIAEVVATQAISADAKRIESVSTEILPIETIKDIGCAIIRSAVGELRDLAKDRFWHASGKHFSKNEIAERKEALADLKTFFYGEGLVDVIECYGLNLTAETIQDGVDSIFEEIEEVAVC